MSILAPPVPEVRDLQRREGRFHWSRLIATILQKHGLVLGERADGAAQVVTRGVRAEDIGADPVVVEGPLEPDVADRCGLATTAVGVDGLVLDDGGGRSWRLVFNRALLRRIPAVGDKTPSTPYLFAPEDGRWTPAGFTAQGLDGPGTPLMFATLPDGRRIVVARDVGGTLVFGAPIFDILVQHHAAPPYPQGYYAMDTSSQLDGLERWLVEQIAVRLEARGIAFARLSPWPHPFRACLSIRHDFDRQMNGAAPRVVAQRLAVRELLAAYASLGLKSTWFWRVYSFEPALIEEVVRAGHEIALHTDVPNGTFAEIEAEYAHFARHGLRLEGVTAHGGAGSIGYVGAAQVDAALRLGMAYGELAGSASTLPCFAHVLNDDVMTATRLVMPAQHHSLDSGMKPGDHWLEDVLRGCGEVLAGGGHAVLMNHPDIHVPEMIAFCRRIPKDGVWPATFAEVARWFRASRSARLASGADGWPTLAFAEPPAWPVAADIVAGGARRAVVFPPQASAAAAPAGRAAAG